MVHLSSKSDEAPSPTGLSGRERQTGLLYLAGFSGLVILARVYEQTPLEGRIWCVFRQGTGLTCPGCGMTRSFTALVQGDVLGSLAAHPLGGLFFIFLGFIALHRGLQSLLNRKISWPLERVWVDLWSRFGQVSLLILLFGLVAFGIWRNMG